MLPQQIFALVGGDPGRYKWVTSEETPPEANDHHTDE
jgi:hypothetical protein